MIRRTCLALLQLRANPRMAIVAVLFVSIFRFVIEFNVDQTAYGDGLVHAMGDSLVVYTATYFVFCGILQLLIPGNPSGIPAVVSLGLLLGVLPPILEGLFPALGGKYYDYMFQWQVSFYDPSFQPLSETFTVWLAIALTGVFVGVATSSLLRGLCALVLAWLALAWMGVIVPSMMWSPGAAAGGLLPVRITCSVAALLTAASVFHISRRRAHKPCLRRMNHALPLGALALCGAAFAHFDASESIWRMLVVLYLCLVILLQNDFYDRVEDQLAAREASSDASDVFHSTVLATLGLLTIARFAPMVAMCASGMLLLGFAYHHPVFRLKENFCLSYTVEGGAALCAFCTGVSGPALFASKLSLAWPCLLIFGGGALFSMPKDWKDVASDRLAKIPTLYVRYAVTPEEELRVHQRIVLALGLGMLTALAGIWRAYGWSVWLPVLLVAAVPVLAVLYKLASRSRAVEVFLTLLGVWLFGASLLLRAVV
ncbi:MAG TPA: hypothetical protein VF331_14565 [Polyangiales bacterium]